MSEAPRARGRAETHEEMRSYLLGFPDDLAGSTERALEWTRSLGPQAGLPRGIALAGLGGSAVGGDLARAILRLEAPVPFEVVRDYRLPAWVEEDALLIASSYSGNTEETLAAFDQGRERGVRTWVVTSGGELARRAREADCPLFLLTAGLPPRAALGHSLPPVLLAACAASGAGVQAHAAALRAAAERLRDWSASWSREEGDGPAVELAQRLARRIPVFYAGTGLYEPVAVRWRAQLAENAKMLSFHHLLPEMDHNEVVGWQENPELLRHLTAVFLTGSHDHPQVLRRIEVTAELIAPVAGGIEIVRAPSGSPLDEMLGLLLLGDWVSLFAAVEHGVEPVPVDRITRLKQLLAQGSAA